MSQHLKDRWGNRSRTSEDDHRSQKYDNRDRNRDQYRSRSRDRSREKHPGRPRSRSRDRGRRERESLSHSRSRSREYTRFSRDRSPSYEGRGSVGDIMPPRPPPLGLVPAPPPLGIIPVAPPPGVLPPAPPPQGCTRPPPPPMSLVARPSHSPSPSPPPSAKSASDIRPTALPLKGSKQFGIKLSLSNTATKPVKKAPKAAVSSVFNNDSSDEEEIPEEARYKLIFAPRVKKRVTHG